jgi:protocatechuate 3,4-dioxygenase beta subunit
MAADTGKPRAGVRVWLTREDGTPLPLALSARTDAGGRYEIRGARKTKSYGVEVPDDPATGHLACQVTVPDTPGYEPVTADVRVARGVIVTGRVIDRTTGKPVPGFAVVEALADNPYVKEYPPFSYSALPRSDTTADDGTFHVVTIPGPVVLMGGAADAIRYRPVVPDPDYPQFFEKKLKVFRGPGGSVVLLRGNFCKVLQIKPGTTVAHQDVVVEQANSVAVQVQDAGGHPLPGVLVTGTDAQDQLWKRPVPVETDTCRAYDVVPGRSRLLVFYAPDTKLAGTLRLTGDEKGPAVVRLRPAGAVKGRLVDAGGKPLAGLAVEAAYDEHAAGEMHAFVHRARRVVTDASGAFVIDGLLPGLPVWLYRPPNRRPFAPARTAFVKALPVEPARTLDVGEIKLTPAPTGGD